MGLKSALVALFSRYISYTVRKMANNALVDQEKIRIKLIDSASETIFGKDHKFKEIKNYKSFQENIPLRSYEELAPYINRVVKGEKNILWPGVPKYFAKTSGTTSGVKYIPLTQDSLPNHINTARNALLNYIAQSGNSHIFSGKVMFLSGSPTLDNKGPIPTGRLSGIVNLEIPSWVKGNQLPSMNINCIDDWESKVDAVVDETVGADLRLISGIPPWVQMYYEKVLAKTDGNSIIDTFKNLTLFVYGGVNYEPYRDKLSSLVGKDLDSIETYPASEGFIAFQDNYQKEGLLLNSNSGIFFEFVTLTELATENPERLQLKDVELDVDYAIIINNNADCGGIT